MFSAGFVASFTVSILSQQKIKAMEQTQTINRKATKAGKFVNTEHVETVRSNYKTERWLPNSQRLGKEDSLSVWYSVEELENFLSVIKEEGGDGVRMYFGAYGHENAPQPLYAGRQTIVMVATKLKDGEGIEANKDLYVQRGNNTTILAYNVGKLCPPWCVSVGDGFEQMEINNKSLVVVK